MTVTVTMQEEVVKKIVVQQEQYTITLSPDAALAMYTICGMIGGPPNGYSRHFRAICVQLHKLGFDKPLNDNVFDYEGSCPTNIYFK